MSQATDLPQLSLQRYFDLVKRRRWQLVPVSLLGLIVGGLVAFFIPRYFVAETLLVHQQLPGGPEDREHPFRGIVVTARSTIPLAVGEALDALAWPEVQVLDSFSREQFERQVESRLTVNDANAWEQKRDFLMLRVVYKDQDGQRSADFLNKLVEVWSQKRIAEVREPAAQARDRAKDVADLAAKVYDGLLSEKQQLERDYGILPNRDIGLQRQEMQADQERQQARAKDLETRRVQHGKLLKRIAAARAKLDTIVPRIPPGSASLADQLKASPEAAKAFAAAQYYLQAAQAFLPGTKQREQRLRTYEASMAQVRALVPQAEVAPDGLTENPDYRTQRELIEKLQAEADALQAEIDVLEEAIRKQVERLQQLTIGYKRYTLKTSQVEEAKQQRADAQADQREAERVLGQLERQLPVKVERPAYVPPEPTDPNILVVAIIGCILGLGAAIGLILVFDFLQGSFKTVDDVERGLAVPVLGGISHLETAEERVAAVRSRRRVSMVAAALLFLTVAVVTLYYFVPTRLPPFVRDLLSMVLGS